MTHRCGPECASHQDLDDAAAALIAASRLLSASLLVSSDDLIASCRAVVRGASARLTGAHAAYLDHFAGTE